MNTSGGRQQLVGISSRWTTGGNHYLAGQAVELTPIMLGLLSAVVAIGIAVTGWKLVRRWRRIDNRHDDLTGLAQLLLRIQVEVRLLADADTMATVADCMTLRTLTYELEPGDVSFAPEVATAITEVIRRLDELLGEATAHSGAATLTRARAQGRAVQAALAAVTAARAVISRLCRQ